MRPVFPQRPCPPSGVDRHILFSLLPLLFLLLLLPAMSWALGGQLNLNTASQEELERLPYVGEGRARAILRQREAGNGFNSLEQLLDNTEIGPATFEAIRPYLKLDGETTLDVNGKDGGRENPAPSLTNKAHFATRAGDLRLLANADFLPVLIDYLHRAERRIDMAYTLVKSTDAPGNRVSQLIDELAGAASRGVKVRVVLEKSSQARDVSEINAESAALLRDKGIRVVLDSPDRTMGARIAVIDERQVFIGSHNLTHSALSANDEISVVIDSPDLARELLAYLDRLAPALEARQQP